MDEFTVAEKDRINLLYGTDFEDITPEDAILIARYERYKAETDAKIKAEVELMKQAAKADAETKQIEHQQAMNNLQEVLQAALKRLERIEDGI